MADNIIIKITTEADLDAAQKQLQALTDKMKQQEKAARDLSDQEKADAETIRTNGCYSRKATKGTSRESALLSRGKGSTERASESNQGQHQGAGEADKGI